MIDVRKNLETELEARASDILTLKQNLADFVEKLDASNKQLELATQEATKLQNKSEKERELYHKRTNLMEKEILDKTRSLDSERKLVTKLRQEFEEKSATVVSTDKAVQNANKALAEKDETIYTMQKTISNLEKEFNALKIDREKTVEAHQSRIKQLQDKFLEQIEQAKRATSDTSKQEMEDKLKLERDASEAKRNELIQSLSELHERSLNSLQQKLKKAETSLAESESLYSSLYEKFQMLESSSFEKSRSLQSQISDLESKLEQAREISANVSKEVTSDLVTKLSKQDAEIKFLKNTVRLECEERMGLLSLVERLRGTASISPAASAPMVTKTRTLTSGRSSKQNLR